MYVCMLCTEYVFGVCMFVCVEEAVFFNTMLVRTYLWGPLRNGHSQLTLTTVTRLDSVYQAQDATDGITLHAPILCLCAYKPLRGNHLHLGQTALAGVLLLLC